MGNVQTIAFGAVGVYAVSQLVYPFALKWYNQYRETQRQNGHFSESSEFNLCVACLKQKFSQRLQTARCGHRYHSECLNLVMELQRTCVLCQQTLSS